MEASWDSLTWNSCLASWFQRLLVSNLKVSKFKSFEYSEIQKTFIFLLEDIDPVLPNANFMFFGTY